MLRHPPNPEHFCSRCWGGLTILIEVWAGTGYTLNKVKCGVPQVPPAHTHHRHKLCVGILTFFRTAKSLASTRVAITNKIPQLCLPNRNKQEVWPDCEFGMNRRLFCNLNNPWAKVKQVYFTTAKFYKYDLCKFLFVAPQQHTGIRKGKLEDIYIWFV